ncbi:colicin transporter [Epibacterium ulvae]|uniref:colicin transporter n=1 Tax=Epibacterium ulvae TaxID=1156985 RepID=UPI001BFC17B8|nr:colicin transporter [Epibacterium ulvae]MBT8152478.1 colicin transporter [Epibacterium ulvae]
MEQIEELQARVLAAMDRITSGVGVLEARQAAAAAATPNVELEQALEEERTANAQLEERLRGLRGRLDELETQAEAAQGSAGDAETIAALEAEVQLLRNEVGNTAERDALRMEVDRLKGALEGAQNEAANSKEHCEMMETEVARLKSELETALVAAAPSDEPVISEVDFAALEAERNRLKDELAAATEAASAADAQVAAAKAEAAQALTAAEAAQATAAQATAAQAEAAQAAAAVPQPVPVEDDETLIKLDQELTSLRTANDQLVQSNTALREANAEGVGDPALINAALQAEVEGLKAANATDRAEMAAVIARLEPLLMNDQTLPQGETE